MKDWRFRSSWKGVLVLQRRIECHTDVSPSGFLWRDATAQDLGDYYLDLGNYHLDLNK